MRRPRARASARPSTSRSQQPEAPQGQRRLRVPERQVPELASLALGTGDRLPVDDEDAADADLDREVENDARILRRSAARLGEACERRVVAGGEWEAAERARYEGAEVDVAPPQRCGLHEPCARDGAGDGDGDRADAADRRRVRCSSTPGGCRRVPSRQRRCAGRPHDPRRSARRARRPRPASRYGRSRLRTRPARRDAGPGGRTGGRVRPARVGRLLGQEAARPQPRGDLGRRAAAQAEDLGRLRPRDPGPLVDEAEDGERARARAGRRPSRRWWEECSSRANILV